MHMINAVYAAQQYQRDSGAAERKMHHKIPFKPNWIKYFSPLSPPPIHKGVIPH